MDRDGTHVEDGELGHLSAATQSDPNRSWEGSEATRRELLRRNRELAAAASVAQATSTAQLDLAGTLERALGVVLEVTGLPAGWILLLPEGGGEPVLASAVGLPQRMVKALAGSRPPECECRKVLDSRRPAVVRPLHADCPIRLLKLGTGQTVTCHATVPLLTRSDVVGVLNVIGGPDAAADQDAADDEPFSFGEHELTLLSAIGRQVGIAIENARLWEALQQRDQLRGQLLDQAIVAQEEERKRIARELHDKVGQALTSLLLGLRTLEAETNGAGGLVVNPTLLQELKTIVADTLDGVRDLALGLRPSVLDDLGLVAALQRDVRSFHTRHRVAVDFQTVGLEGVRLPPAVETALYRIIQQALINVVQHADAGRVSLLLEARTQAVVAIVEDDGCGFEADRLMRGPADKRWLGLHGMRERAELLGGTLTVESAPGSGTTVFVEVPLRSGQDGQRE